jgi:hypothetical protein
VGKLDILIADNYIKPEMKNCESLDSCYYNKESKTLYIFQSAISLDHPVKSNVLITILKLLNMYEMYLKNEFEMILDFVIPGNIRI